MDTDWIEKYNKFITKWNSFTEMCMYIQVVVGKRLKLDIENNIDLEQDENEYKKAMVVFYEIQNALPLKKLFLEQYDFAIKNYFL